MESAMVVEEPQQPFTSPAWHPQGPPLAAWAYRSLTICRIFSESFSFIFDLLRLENCFGNPETQKTLYSFPAPPYRCFTIKAELTGQISENSFVSLIAKGASSRPVRL
jgi:hypothetical protein